jgi:hypothetical protein
LQQGLLTVTQRLLEQVSHGETGDEDTRHIMELCETVLEQSVSKKEVSGGVGRLKVLAHSIQAEANLAADTLTELESLSGTLLVGDHAITVAQSGGLGVLVEVAKMMLSPTDQLLYIPEPQRRAILAESIRGIGRLSSSANLVVPNECVSAILTAMRLYQDDASMSDCCTRALMGVAANPANASLLTQLGFVDKVMAAHRTFSHDHAMHVTVCNTLRLVCQAEPACVQLVLGPDVLPEVLTLLSMRKTESERLASLGLVRLLAEIDPTANAVFCHEGALSQVW